MKGEIDTGTIQIWLGEGLEIKFDPTYSTVDFADGSHQVNIWIGSEREQLDHLIEVLQEAREFIS